jgi:TonB family protein
MRNEEIVSGTPRLLAAWLFPLVVAMLLVGGWTCNGEVKVSEADAKRAAVVKPMPALSPVARQLKLSGHVELEVHISEAGGVDSVKPVVGNPVLVGDATAAVKRWKFAPFTADGAPAKAVTAISFDFKQ